MAEKIDCIKQKTSRVTLLKNLEWEIEEFLEMKSYLEKQKETSKTSLRFTIEDERLSATPYIYLYCYILGDKFGLTLSCDERLCYSAIHYKKTIVANSESEDQTEEKFCYHDLEDGKKYEDLTQLKENSAQKNVFYLGANSEGKMFMDGYDDLKDGTLRIGVIIGFEIFDDKMVETKDGEEKEVEEE